MNWISLLNIIAILFAIQARAAFALVDQSITQGPPANHFWAFNAGVQQFRLHGDRGNDIVGRAGQIGFGLAQFLNDRWLIQGLVDLHAGPWEAIRDSSFSADFSGTGATFETMFSLSSSTLRSGSSNWVGVLSLSYVDMVGRSVGPNHKEPPNPYLNYQEQSYQINMTAIWLNPGIEWTFVQSPRFTGNTPELLATRIEGYSLRLAAGLPVYATYRARTVRRDETPNASPEPKEMIDKGRLRGYSVITSLHAWLGS